MYKREIFVDCAKRKKGRWSVVSSARLERMAGFPEVKVMLSLEFDTGATNKVWTKELP